MFHLMSYISLVSVLLFCQITTVNILHVNLKNSFGFLAFISLLICIRGQRFNIIYILILLSVFFYPLLDIDPTYRFPSCFIITFILSVTVQQTNLSINSKSHVCICNSSISYFSQIACNFVQNSYFCGVSVTELVRFQTLSRTAITKEFDFEIKSDFHVLRPQNPKTPVFTNVYMNVRTYTRYN